MIILKIISHYLRKKSLELLAITVFEKFITFLKMSTAGNRLILTIFKTPRLKDKYLISYVYEIIKCQSESNSNLKGNFISSFLTITPLAITLFTDIMT